MPYSPESCSALIKQINDNMQKNANNQLRSTNLTLSQIRMLQYLNTKEDKSDSFKNLERRFDVAQSTIVGIVHRLEQKGLVETFGSSADKRIRMVRLTPASAEKCEVGDRSMQMAETNLLRGLNKQEQEDFYRLLKKVRETML